ncbi:MAG: phosphatidate cytidylyltransferase [Erysipelotrichales bacterium]|nr:phosphatidate cytidylyltransferase [Erysipelotrichales bacterium]MBQ1385836.1 phosphatidate cytidylyltransferase [Erysipelotrichales bacterium]MBQ2478473.1 phosphatidate cytidylyltransferase [Erysipelotrichales bacterium]MBQ4012270.1 phosphatidate cytidylyltransferase [Erysipelotrichales bacterium]MBQ4375170.1 phosphatidate cytidylyltransferase [Erysipelotrichales bacterium]
MKDRWITGGILAVILIGFVLLGGHFLDIPVTLALVAASYDITRIFVKKWPMHMLWTVPLCTLAITVSSFFHETVSLILFGAFLIYLTVMMIADEKVKIEDISITAFLHILILFALRGFNLLQTQGKYAFAVLILLTCMTDIGAYIIGRHFGKHKLIERLSPKKTIEGSVGGFVIGAASGIAGFLLLTKMNPGIVLLLSVGGSLVGQVGDLFFSAIKRHYGIKDYGNYLKGHGGALDRIDSILFSMLYGYLVLLIAGLL